MARDRFNCSFSFWAFFCPFTPPPRPHPPPPPQQPKKSKFKRKWKKHLEISSFDTCVPQIMIRWRTAPEIWCATDGRTDGRMDGWMDRRKKWHIEVGVLPKNPHLFPWIGKWNGCFSLRSLRIQKYYQKYPINLLR